MKPIKYLSYTTTLALAIAGLIGTTSIELFNIRNNLDMVNAAAPEIIVTNENEMINAVAAGGNIKIGADFECYRKIEIKDHPVNINLNNHTVTLNLSMDINNDTVITGNGTFDNGIFLEGKSLTLENGDIKGMIILNGSNPEFYMNGGKIKCIDQHGGYSKLSGGEISGSSSSGVNLSYGIFEMTGGQIINNSSSGVHLLASDEDNEMYEHRFIMSGGEITANNYHGVSCSGGGQIDIKDGKIANNMATGLSTKESNVTMSGGTITTNKGGGVRLRGKNIFTLIGGEIIYNRSDDSHTSYAGVKYDEDDVFKISGAPIITGNTDRNGNLLNVELNNKNDTSGHKNKQIVLIGPLLENCSIGVYGYDNIDFTKNYKQYQGYKRPTDYFVSDIKE